MEDEPDPNNLDLDLDLDLDDNLDLDLDLDLDLAAVPRASPSSSPDSRVARRAAPFSTLFHTTLNHFERWNRRVVLQVNAHLPYGYIILAVALLTKAMTSPGQSPVIGTIKNAVEDTLHISSVTLSTLYMAATIASAVTLPFVGRLLDSIGPQATGMLAILGLASACFVLARLATTVPVLLLSLYMLRLFGQGSMMLVASFMLNSWYIVRRGRIQSIAAVGVSLFILGIFPSVTLASVESIGWRRTYENLGLVLLFLMLPVALVFFRGKPELYGLLPDNVKEEEEVLEEEEEEEEEVVVNATAEERNFSLGEALRVPAFWIFATSNLCSAMIATGLWFHMVAIMDEQNVDSDVLKPVYVATSIVATCASLAGGFLLERFPENRVAGVGMVLLALCVAISGMLRLPGVPFLYGMLLGAQGGLSGVVSSMVMANLFGRQHLGAIQGVATGMGVFGSAVGPLPFSALREATGSYNIIAWFCLWPLLQFALLLFAKKPQRQTAAYATL